jgi:hypothetical protein
MRAHVWTRMKSFTATVVLVAGVTTTANAQAKTTSQQRIPVQKESAGDVARRDSSARADSIAAAAAAAEAARRDSVARAEAAARQDSINKADMARRDSVARADSIAKAAAAVAAAEAARRDSIAREDSIRNAAAAAQRRFGNKGFFGGFAAGYSGTSGKYGDVYEPGWNITIPIGWQRRAGRWGFRSDFMYDSHGGASVTQEITPESIIPTPFSAPAQVTTRYDVEDGAVWSGNLDVVVDLAKWGLNRLSQFYLIGGGGLHYFEGAKVVQTPLEPLTGATAPAPPSSYKTDSQTKFGLNGGAGFGFAVGRTSLFIESRYFTAYTDNTNSEWIPVILGVKWR